ncbi:G patch domain-containing protein 1 homolog [Babesia microti strain RI]|uniref:G patch domain-containing protein 1 homolog n=1 Tax=Babesia microti (strain RI) TaxID=1133968 RepID=A0A1N6LYD4_BABMR|nr:G patch domain-containing protein 1 homolog [Babesia microti strain RI]SIO73888.1 G patch domain-containing protein 1 homolog [Babesia microti strain RI]|eukprot:XP_021337939.1 G patch domain-containing protein 1 homolog [Babesia microti strain RI]
MSVERTSCSFLGTPLTNHDLGQVRGRKVSKTEDRKFDVIAQVRQLRRGEKERISMHGAFTGGFAAGYKNTVGSKEGWAPKSFKSSRTSRTEHVVQTAEDFMDDEDNVTILKISNEFFQSVDELDKLFEIKSNSFGSNLLSKIKWLSKLAKPQKKKIIGPQLPSNMKEHTAELFTRRKGDFSGIGYNQKTILKRSNSEFDEYGCSGLEYYHMGLDNDAPSLEDINKRLEYKLEFVEVKDENNTPISSYITVPDSFNGKHVDDSEEDFEKMLKIMGNWRPLEEPQSDQIPLEVDGLDEMQKLQETYSKLVNRIEFVKQGVSTDTKVEKRGGRSIVDFSFDQSLFKKFKLKVVDNSHKLRDTSYKQRELSHTGIQYNREDITPEIDENIVIDNEKAIPPDELFKAIFGGDSDNDD